MERLKLNIQLFASTSGNLTTGANEDGTTFYLNWQQTTQGIDSQGRPYTRINWQIGINARYEYYSNAVQMGATTINGVQVHGGGTWSYIGTGTHQLANGSTTIYHNTNGTKTFSASISGWTIGCSWVSGSKSWELTRIPTASKVESVTFETDLQGRTNNIEKPFTIVFTRYDSSFTDNLKIQYSTNPQDSTTWVTFKTIENIDSGAIISFTQNELNTIYNAMTSRITVPLQFILETYSGETLIGTSEPLGRIGGIYDANPTFSGVTFQDTNSTTTALTGNNQIIVKGYSNATITIPVATGNKGATIVDYVIEGVDEPIAHTGSELYHTINGCTFGTFNVYARDSRGNTTLSTVIASSTKSYEKIYLDISNSKIERWENGSESATGDEAKLTLSGTIWNNSFGSVNNSITSSEYRLKITDSSGSPVAGTTDITPTINQDGTITFTGLIRSDNADYSWNVGDSYYIYITVADELSSASITLTLNSAKPNIAIHKNGVGIGAAYDTSAGGSLQIDGKPFLDYLYPVGAIYTSVNSTSPQTLFGGTWERIKGKFLLSADEDEHWVYIANEGSSYTFTDSATIRYGAGTKWITKTVSAGTYTLNTSFFGGTDPVPGTAKTTQILIKTTAGSTSGEYYHKLVIPEMPSHNHTLLTRGGSGGSWSVSTVSSTVQASDTSMIKNAGSNASHNNMPPYLAVYMWQRTA